MVFEIPSNLILHRLGARRWIARIAISWGLVSMAMMFVRGTTSFYVLRILLGIAECGMFPGIILYLTCWYPAHRRSRMIAMFMAALPLSGLVGGPLSGSIMHMMAGLFGLRGWQWLFCLEGAPALVIGAIIWRVLPDQVSDAQWLTDQEKRIVLNNIASENGAKPKATVKLALTSLRILVDELDLIFVRDREHGHQFLVADHRSARGPRKRSRRRHAHGNSLRLRRFRDGRVGDELGPYTRTALAHRIPGLLRRRAARNKPFLERQSYGNDRDYDGSLDVRVRCCAIDVVTADPFIT